MAAVAVEVDIAVWRAIAGVSVEIPRLGDSVYYFPQGHLEHNSIEPSALDCRGGLARPHFICRVKSIRLLSHPSSEEVFAVFLLQPEEGPRAGSVTATGKIEGRGISDVVGLAKVLTQSDVNNGGGFSVPRTCAEFIFPRLNLEVERSVQQLRMKDTHNKIWEFRHVYRATPRRHLLATGWGNFVNVKRLSAGDSVVFVKKTSTNELFIGIRRAQRLGLNNDFICGGKSSRSYTREPMEAIENAANGRAFEVVYYPKIGWPNFLVSVEKVTKAMSRSWSAGMPIKMAVEADNSSQLTWFQGMVAAVTMPDFGPWCGSPWRMLEVNWVGKSIQRINPWDVEPIKMEHSVLLSPKKEYKPIEMEPPVLSSPKKEYKCSSYFGLLQAREDRQREKKERNDKTKAREDRKRGKKERKDKTKEDRDDRQGRKRERDHNQGISPSTYYKLYQKLLQREAEAVARESEDRGRSIERRGREERQRLRRERRESKERHRITLRRMWKGRQEREHLRELYQRWEREKDTEENERRAKREK